MADYNTSQAEVWDDSALLESWNDALEEYKKYHSLAAKGEKVARPIKASDDAVNGGKAIDSVQDLEADVDATDGDVAAQANAQTTTIPVPPAAMMPQSLIGGQDEDLKKLMMSWYYAGYYTGLHEGKQQGYASAMQGGGKG
ncbi:hypothetical protein BDY17DRAFT_326842 [Neohortaea acidophila]|uniref:Uncharacterized protein n=1 Tax=Neohortaea acidophila TaxID=245834 RepID=A0A6A6PJZ4_9PEZI|nr:uncharacterized protein BDY17DRAFT_326842 [Neohortaea acidophila]KAF2479833.1 hypothetical protein BDY17DRAFT_326842 [Neohortaea acidophila]